MVRYMAPHGFVTSQTMVIDFNRFMFGSLPPIVFPQSVEKIPSEQLVFLARVVFASDDSIGFLEK
jgi:hypothetical protein